MKNKKHTGDNLQNFEKDGAFFITGEIDESIAKEITAPLIERILEEKEKVVNSLGGGNKKSKTPKKRRNKKPKTTGVVRGGRHSQ